MKSWSSRPSSSLTTSSEARDILSRFAPSQLLYLPPRETSITAISRTPRHTHTTSISQSLQNSEASFASLLDELSIIEGSSQPAVYHIHSQIEYRQIITVTSSNFLLTNNSFTSYSALNLFYYVNFISL